VTEKEKLAEEVVFMMTGLMSASAMQLPKQQEIIRRIARRLLDQLAELETGRPDVA
jgi:hypothetical protein